MASFQSEATIYISGANQVEYYHEIDLQTVEQNGINENCKNRNHIEYESETDVKSKEKLSATKTLDLSELINGHDNEIGQKQSPINIVQSETSFDVLLKNGGFVIHYLPEDIAVVKNMGHAWQINLNPITTSTLHASHLNGLYKLYQVHCHWGSEPNNGSEHTIDGIGYAAEIHFVHYKMSYGSFENALKHADGLAVLGIFLTESDTGNDCFQKLTKALRRIPYKGDSVPFSDINLMDLIPKNQQFWTYTGSLTTPPFAECVIWTIFRNPIQISQQQLNAFRSLYSIPNANDSKALDLAMYTIVNNVRPSQSVNGRTVRASFMFDALIDL